MISLATGDFHPEAGANVTQVYQQAIQRLFDGFDLLEPGLVQPAAWRPGAPIRPPGPALRFYCGDGRGSAPAADFRKR